MSGNNRNEYQTESFMNEDGELHIVPTIDYLRHWFNQNCWCSPHWDEKNQEDFLSNRTKQMVFNHKKMMLKENQH